VREVLHQEVDGVGVLFGLELLAREYRLVVSTNASTRPLADHDHRDAPAHLVHALMDGRDQLDHRERLAV
jgi:hypothetical protein